MKHIFYFLAIFPIMYEIISLYDTGRVHRFVESMKGDGYDFKKGTDKQKLFPVYVFSYIVWNFIGFLSFQWVLFFGLFLLGLIPKKYMWIRKVDAFLSLCILIFIVLNAYHFQIDFWSLIKQNLWFW